MAAKWGMSTPSTSQDEDDDLNGTDLDSDSNKTNATSVSLFKQNAGSGRDETTDGNSVLFGGKSGSKPKGRLPRWWHDRLHIVDGITKAHSKNFAIDRKFKELISGDENEAEATYKMSVIADIRAIRMKLDGKEKLMDATVSF